MGEREGPNREPGRKKHRLRAGLTAGAVLIGAAVSGPRPLPSDKDAEAHYSRSVPLFKTDKLPVASEIPIFSPTTIPIIKELSPPTTTPALPSYEAVMPEIREKTTYKDIKGKVQSVDLRPDLTIIVVKKEDGNLASFSFWDENVNPEP